MQDYLKIANSGWMWFAVAVPMAVLAWQVFLLLRRSLRDGRRMGVRNEQIKSAVIASASASIGPSVSILTGMVSLMVMMGAPIAWMRLSYIGAVMFEMTSADVGAEAVGTAAATLGCYCSLTFNKMYPVAIDNKNIYATIGGALTILLLTMWNKKRRAKWVSNWSATLAMIVGLIFACIV